MPRSSFARAVLALTAVVVLANLAFVALSIRDYFAENDIRAQIAAYALNGATIEDSGLADYYTRAVCPGRPADPACAGRPEDRAALIPRLCAARGAEVTHSTFGLPTKGQAEAIAASPYCLFASPRLSGWRDAVGPGLAAEAYVLIVAYAELLAIGLAWRRWTRLAERIALLAGLALSLAAYGLVSDQYSTAMRAIAALAVMALMFALVWLGRRLRA